MSVLHKDQFLDVILEEAKRIYGTTYFKSGKDEMLIIATENGCRSWKVPEDLRSPEKYKTVSQGEVTVCVIDENSIACVSLFSADNGRHHIDVMEMENEEWYVLRSIRVKLGWKYVYDVCVTNNPDGPLLVMCSWKDESVAAVGLNDGKIKWTNDTKKAGMKLDIGSVCADDSNRLFVANHDLHTIYELSPEDGSIISILQLSPLIRWPKCIRFHHGNLLVAHVDDEVYKATKEKKSKISLYTVG